MSLLVSLTIEITQLIIGRVFDVDDILLNVCGGILGYVLFKIIDKIKDKLPSFLKNEIFYNIIVFILTLLVMIYICNVLGVVF